MKYLFFVSCGRSGTVRLYELLSKYLPQESYTVVHQMKYSRLANIVGNILFETNRFERLKELLFMAIISRYSKLKNFVSTDPLSAMVIPEKLLKKPDTYVVHVVRDHDEFARSMVALTRKRLKSWLAHNFIPFWQPGIFPLENQLGRCINSKYRRVSIKKSRFFGERYGYKYNYRRVKMKELFSENSLADIIEDTIGEVIVIPKEELLKRANES